jgi:hypothetical protein
MNATRYLGYLFAVTFRAPYLSCLVLANGLGALERLAAFLTAILISRHSTLPNGSDQNVADHLSSAATQLKARVEARGVEQAAVPTDLPGRPFR